MNRAPEPLRDGAQFVEIANMVDRLKEARAAVVSALYDVLGNVRSVKAWRARHAACPCGLGTPCDESSAVAVGRSAVVRSEKSTLTRFSDRRGLMRMGPKSEASARQTLRVLEQNPKIVPPRFDLAAARHAIFVERHARVA